MKKVLYLTAFAMIALAWTSCSKNAQTSGNQGEQVASEEVIIVDEPQADEVDYDAIMDMYEEAIKNNDLEVISATSENLAEVEMEGLLTPAQVERWHKLD